MCNWPDRTTDPSLIKVLWLYLKNALVKPCLINNENVGFVESSEANIRLKYTDVFNINVSFKAFVSVPKKKKKTMVGLCGII